MAKVGIHCYACPAVIEVDSDSPEQGLRSADWYLVHGATYCPVCALARGLAASPDSAGLQPADRFDDKAAPSLPPGSEGAPNGTSVDPSPPPAAAHSAALSREVALLAKLDVGAKRDLALGALAAFVGLLLFAGLAANGAAVALAVFTLIGLVIARFWSDRAQRANRQAIGIVLAIFGFLLVAQPLAHGWEVTDLGEMLRWVMLPLGAGYLWAGLRSLRYLPLARRSLSQPTYDVRLEIQIRRGYGGIPYTEARIWPSDPAMLPRDGKVAHPLAQFSWQASEPQLVKLEAVPAQVHGAPTDGAVAIVSSPQAVLVGRVKRSHFGEPSAPPRPMSPLLAWLSKPRHLRLP